MHIADGILPASIWAGGGAAALAAAALALRRFDERRLPRVAVMASLFFVASGVAVPIGPASWHLLLNGLVGIVLAWDAIPAILVALFLQYILLHDGGITTLGVNTVTMAGGAIAAHCAMRSSLRLLGGRTRAYAACGFLAGAAAIATSAALFGGILVLAERSFAGFAGYAVAAQVPLFIAEPPITAFAAAFLARVKPELIAAGGRVRPAATAAAIAQEAGR